MSMFHGFAPLLDTFKKHSYFKNTWDLKILKIQKPLQIDLKF